jgi:hypothetical protein
MTLRREITKPRRETGARSLEDLRRTRTVRRGSEGRARRPQACRNSGSAIAAEGFMNNAGEIRPPSPIARYLNIALIGLWLPLPHLNSVAILVEVEDFDNSLMNPLHECG